MPVVTSRSNSPKGVSVADLENKSGEEDQPESEEWPALEILAEDRYNYRIRWAGINPDTGREWEPSWHPKKDATQALVEDWVRRKRQRTEASTPKGKGKSRKSIARTSKAGGRNRRTAAAQILSREGSVASSSVTESILDPASARQPFAGPSVPEVDASSVAEQSSQVHCPETPQSNGIEPGSSRRSSIQSDPQSSAPPSAVQPLPSSQPIPNGDHEIQVTQRSDFDPAAYPAVSPQFSSQVDNEIEDSINASLITEPKLKTFTPHKGAGIVPDSQSQAGSSSFVPSTQSKRSSGATTLLPTQDLTSQSVQVCMAKFGS